MAAITTVNSSGTASSGSFTANILTSFTLAKMIIIKAATNSTTFDIKITDRHGHTVLDVDNVTGEYNQTVEIPTYGNWTLEVSNASVDEQFDYLFVFMTHFS